MFMCAVDTPKCQQLVNDLEDIAAQRVERKSTASAVMEEVGTQTTLKRPTTQQAKSSDLCTNGVCE